jgi:hypothetical protein
VDKDFILRPVSSPFYTTASHYTSTIHEKELGPNSDFESHTDLQLSNARHKQQRQDTIRTVVQFPHVFFAPRDSVRAAQTCPHLLAFVKRSFITQICMKIEMVMQLLKNLHYQISPISVDWKHTEGRVHTIPLCLFWICTSRIQRTVTARRWNEGHIQHITTEVKKSTKAYGN